MMILIGKTRKLLIELHLFLFFFSKEGGDKYLNVETNE